MAGSPDRSGLGYKEKRGVGCFTSPHGAPTPHTRRTWVHCLSSLLQAARDRAFPALGLGRRPQLQPPARARVAEAECRHVQVNPPRGSTATCPSGTQHPPHAEHTYVHISIYTPIKLIFPHLHLGDGSLDGYLQSLSSLHVKEKRSDLCRI